MWDATSSGTYSQNRKQIGPTFVGLNNEDEQKDMVSATYKLSKTYLRGLQTFERCASFQQGPAPVMHFYQQ